MALTLNQIDAIRTAYLDLVGSLQSFEQNIEHDWIGHKLSIQDLEFAFKDVLEDIIVKLNKS